MYSLLHIRMVQRCCGPHAIFRSRRALSLGIGCATGVGLFELHPAACDSLSNVRFHIVVEVLELVDEVLWVVFVAFVWYGFVVGGVGIAAARFWAHVKVRKGFGALWLGAHFASTAVLLVVTRVLVILDGFCELRVAA